MANKTKCIFDIKDVKVQDLTGEMVDIGLTKEQFARILYNNAKSFDMDMFAREIFKHGKAEITEEVKKEFREHGHTVWNHRVIASILELIDKL